MGRLEHTMLVPKYYVGTYLIMSLYAGEQARHAHKGLQKQLAAFVFMVLSEVDVPMDLRELSS